MDTITRRNSKLALVLSTFLTLSAGGIIGCAGEDSADDDDDGQNESDIIINPNKDKAAAKDAGADAEGGKLRDGGAEGGGDADADAFDASSEATAPICTPGAIVFCRCADRSEGTKECIDAYNFSECACD